MKISGKYCKFIPSRLLLCLTVILAGCGSKVALQVPVPPQEEIPALLKVENISPEIARYLRAEQDYFHDTIQRYSEVTKELYREAMENRPSLNSTPARYGPYLYSLRVEDGLKLPLLLRKKDGDKASQVVLDFNHGAAINSRRVLHGFRMSPDHKKLLFSFSPDVHSPPTLVLYEIETKKFIDTKIDNVASFEWLSDESEVLVVQHGVNQVPTLGYFNLNQGPSSYKPLYFARDARSFLSLKPSSRLEFFFIVESRESSEQRIEIVNTKSLTSVPLPLPIAQADRALQLNVLDNDLIVLIERRQIRRLFRYKNFFSNSRSLKAPKLLAEDSSQGSLKTFQILKDYLIVSRTKSGVGSIEITKWNGEQIEIPNLGLAEVSLDLGLNPNLDSSTIQFQAQAWTRPTRAFEFNLKELTINELVTDSKSTSAKVFEKQFISYQALVTSKDGTKVPLTIITTEEATLKPRPFLVTGYGAYGVSLVPEYNFSHRILLEHGVSIAIAHVRGGGELGSAWHSAGQGMQKSKSFEDFIACTEFLISTGLSSSGQIASRGRSAGGLLVAASAQMRPDLFKAVVAEVPFVDVAQSLRISALRPGPLELSEWGDPADNVVREYQESYSPIEQVRPQAFPALLVTTSIRDEAVNFSGPLRWVAKMRRLNPEARIMLRISENNTHSGPDTGHDQLEQESQLLGFILTEITRD